VITQISYQYRTGMFNGTDEFKDLLKKDYNVHERPIWMPAAGGNYEMWFDFFVDTTVIDFLKSAVLGGMAFEIVKMSFFMPFLKALEKLNHVNDYSLEIQKYCFYFEDCKIVIYGLTENITSIFSGVFKEIYISFELIKKAGMVEKISELRIPVEKDSRRNEWWVGPGELDLYLTYWGVSIHHGVEQLLWDVKSHRLIEC